MVIVVIVGILCLKKSSYKISFHIDFFNILFSYGEAYSIFIMEYDKSRFYQIIVSEWLIFRAALIVWIIRMPTHRMK